MVDLAVVLIVVVSALWGYMRGILRRVLFIASLVVAYLGSAPLGPWLGGMIAARVDWPANACYTVGRIAGGLLIYVSLTVCAQVMDRKLGHTRAGYMRLWNRNWGLVGGLASGLLIALIVLFVADSMLKAFPEASGSLAEAARRSTLRRMVSRFNPGDRFLVTDVLRLLRASRDDPAAVQRLSEQEEVRSLLEHPDVRSVMNDAELGRALRAGEVDVVLQNENLRRLLKSRDLRQRLVAPGIREALKEAMQRPSGEIPSEEPSDKP